MALEIEGKYWIITNVEYSKGFGTNCTLTAYKDKATREIGIHKFLPNTNKRFGFVGELSVEELYALIKQKYPNAIDC